MLEIKNKQKQSGVWFISDTHFGHRNILKYSNRPYQDQYEMDKTLIDNWNAVVKPNDVVYHLGDFAFSRIERIIEVLERLNGNKHFVHGNHDKEILNNSDLLIRNGLFKSISPYKEIKVDGQFIILFHYGMRVWNKSHHGSWNLYGHSHGSLPPYGKSVDVGVDAKFITEEYRPISFEEVRDFMRSRSEEYMDYHGN